MWSIFAGQEKEIERERKGEIYFYFIVMMEFHNDFFLIKFCIGNGVRCVKWLIYMMKLEISVR